MQSEGSPCRVEAVAAEDEELQLQSALLRYLLDTHPIQLTEDELVSALARNPEDFGERDGIDRAVCDLAAIGLVRRHGPLVMPTLTAFRAYELWEV